MTEQSLACLLLRGEESRKLAQTVDERLEGMGNPMKKG